MLTKLKIAFLKWQIKILLKKYHLSRNPIGSGRKKSVQKAEKEYYESEVKREGLGDEISADYRNQNEKWPGHRTGD